MLDLVQTEETTGAIRNDGITYQHNCIDDLVVMRI